MLKFIFSLYIILSLNSTPKREIPRVAAILSLTEVESAWDVYAGSGKLATGVVAARRRGDAGGVYVLLPTTGGV